jgi:hypothetical protein
MVLQECPLAPSRRAPARFNPKAALAEQTRDAPRAKAMKNRPMSESRQAAAIPAAIHATALYERELSRTFMVAPQSSPGLA